MRESVKNLLGDTAPLKFLLPALLVGALGVAQATPVLAHDPETFLKGDVRIENGFTDKGNVEAKRGVNTGRGMPSILGPFPEDSFGLDFVGQLTTAELSVARLEGTGSPFLSDIWGWSDSDKRSDCHGDEYALVGTSSGVSIARITDASADPGPDRDTPVFLGLIPTINPNTLLNFWWDLKVYEDKVYWTTEVLGDGLGVFDLTQLCALDAAPEGGLLEADKYLEITLGTDRYRAAHNITINEDTGHAFLTGVTSFDRSVSRDPMWIVDLNQAGGDSVEAAGAVMRIVNSSGSTVAVDSHDAQAVSYTGPDRQHRRKQIAMLSAGFNHELVILDVTDPASPSQVSTITYAGASFSHQGWFDESQTYFFLGDEEDELFGISDPQNPDLPDTTRTYVFDMTDLDSPQFLCFFDAPYAAIDHNMFVMGNFLYQANYTSGFTVWEIPAGGPDADQETCGMTMVGHMDTEPRLPNVNMNHNINIFIGPWGIYPYFASEKIIVSDGLNGLIVGKISDGQ